MKNKRRAKLLKAWAKLSIGVSHLDLLVTSGYVTEKSHARSPGGLDSARLHLVDALVLIDSIIEETYK